MRVSAGTTTGYGCHNNNDMRNYCMALKCDECDKIMGYFSAYSHDQLDGTPFMCCLECKKKDDGTGDIEDNEPEWMTRQRQEYKDKLAAENVDRS